MFKQVLISSALLLSAASSIAGEWRGEADIQYRYFVHPANEASQIGDAQQYQSNPSLSFQPEYFTDLGDSGTSLSFIPFVRYDQRDDQRTHADIRELMLTAYGDDWEWKAGIGKVYWGVTETRHLVDVINQVDLLEGPSGEDKLGQAMLNYTMIRDYGNFDAFVLFGHRAQEFAGPNGRLRPPFGINDAQYESEQGNKHVDLSFRWSHSIGNLDIGVHEFIGTNRDFVLKEILDNPDAAGFSGPIPKGLNLTPFYDQINQTGLDMQYFLGGLTLKLEAIYRRSDVIPDFLAYTAGFEFTTVGILGTAQDVGWILEYNRDERDPVVALTPFQNDLFGGLRWVMNDAASTEVLIGYFVDFDDSTANGGSIEASHRFTDHWVLEVEGALYNSTVAADPLSFYNNDDYVQIEAQYHF